MKFFILAFIVACSSPTPYQKKKKGEGYTDSQTGQIRSTEFHANSYTKIEDAHLMAQFRAIEVCDPKLTYFLETSDLSKVKNITRTSGSYPFYNTGYYPYRRGWSVGVGFGTYPSESWQVKQVYPLLKVRYLCGDQFYAPRGEFKSVSASELSHVHKDLMGAIIVVDIDEKESLEKGDIILKMNNKRVESLGDFYYRFQSTPQSQLEILRDGKRQTLKVQAQDVTGDIRNYSQEIRNKMCKKDKKVCSKKD